MKKLLLSAMLVSVAAVAYGQGTVAFFNGGLTKVNTNSIDVLGAGTGARGVVGLTPNFLYYGVFAGATANDLVLANTTLGQNSTATTGLIAIPGQTANVYPLTGWAVGSTPVIQIRAWSQSLGVNGWQTAEGTLGAWYGESKVITAPPLGPGTGPGAVIWSASAAALINPFDIYLQVPEPSTIALVGLGLLGLLVIRRRK